MWFNGREEDLNGERVLLFQPKPAKELSSLSCKPTNTHIGGYPSFFDNDVCPMPEKVACDVCGKFMHLLLQLNAPIPDFNLENRTLYVFGCNSITCFKEKNNNAQFCLGNGVFKCLRSQAVVHKQVKKKTILIDDDEGGEWDISETDLKNNVRMNGHNGDLNLSWDNDDVFTSENYTQSMDQLEFIINSLEIDGSKPLRHDKKKSKKKSSAVHRTTSSLSKSGDFFCQIDLEYFEEPRRNNSDYVGEESDDENISQSKSRKSHIDEKIQKIMNKYLEEEDDPEILNLFRIDSKNAQSSVGVYLEEKYESLSPDQHEFFVFMNKVKRAPGQIVRYAYGGIPMWSVPTSLNQNCSNRADIKSKEEFGKLATISSGTQQSTLVPTATLCTCGKKRIFEFQIMPTILHVLKVDQVISSKVKENIRDKLLATSGPMDWGVLAIFSCPDSCDQSREECVIVQASMNDIETTPFSEMQSQNLSKDDLAESNELEKELKFCADD